SMASDFTRYTVSASRLSTASRRTAKSAKMRRREDRKRARGKKGSPYEVEYLFGSLSRLVDRFNTLQGDVKTILHTFISLAYIDKAKNLQNSFGKLEEDIVAGIEQLDVNTSAYIPIQVAQDDETQSTQVQFTKSSVRKQAWKIEVLENL
ncbi:8999_t:CDS:2, partial [Paraglomus brasilianum]